METFYSVETYPGNMKYYFKTKESAVNFLWEYYLDWQENDNEETQNQAWNFLTYTDEIPNYGHIYEEFFEDVDIK